MNDISNKSVTFVVLGVIMISLFSTIVALKFMGADNGPTGLATSGQGLVNLSVQQVVSISMVDALINFGACSPVGGAVTNITSERTLNTTVVCPSFATADNLSIANDGNINASVSMNSTKVGKQDNTTVGTANVLLNSSTGTSSLKYKSTSSGRSPNTGGCTAGTVAAYTTIYAPNYGYPICTNLRTHDTINSVAVDFAIQVPQDAPTGVDSTTLNFLAIASATP